MSWGLSHQQVLTLYPNHWHLVTLGSIFVQNSKLIVLRASNAVVLLEASFVLPCFFRWECLTTTKHSKWQLHRRCFKLPGILFSSQFQMKRKYYVRHSWIQLSSTHDLDLFCANFDIEMLYISFGIVGLISSCVLSFPTQLQKPDDKEIEAFYSKMTLTT